MQTELVPDSHETTPMCHLPQMLLEDSAHCPGAKGFLSSSLSFPHFTSLFFPVLPGSHHHTNASIPFLSPDLLCVVCVVFVCVYVYICYMCILVCTLCDILCACVCICMLIYVYVQDAIMCAGMCMYAYLCSIVIVIYVCVCTCVSSV
jgi:hypothetical protein